MEKDLDKIFSKYLSGEMSPDEKNEFVEKLSLDSTLKLAFDNHRLGKIAGERVHHNELKMKVGAIIKEESSKGKQRHKSLYLTIASIAAISVLILYFVLSPSPQPEALYATYYKPPPYGPTRLPSETNENLDDVRINFSKKNWSETINLISNLENELKNEGRTQRMLAHALINAGQEEKGISIFKQLLNESSQGSKLDDQWYIGLAYLRASNLDSSLVYITNITNGDPNFHEYQNAEDLITIIKKLK